MASADQTSIVFKKKDSLLQICHWYMHEHKRSFTYPCVRIYTPHTYVCLCVCVCVCMCILYIHRHTQTIAHTPTYIHPHTCRHTSIHPTTKHNVASCNQVTMMLLRYV